METKTKRFDEMTYLEKLVLNYKENSMWFKFNRWLKKLNARKNKK